MNARKPGVVGPNRFLLCQGMTRLNCMKHKIKDLESLKQIPSLAIPPLFCTSLGSALKGRSPEGSLERKYRLETFLLCPSFSSWGRFTFTQSKQTELFVSVHDFKESTLDTSRLLEPASLEVGFLNCLGTFAQGIHFRNANFKNLTEFMSKLRNCPKVRGWYAWYAS